MEGLALVMLVVVSVLPMLIGGFTHHGDHSTYHSYA